MTQSLFISALLTAMVLLAISGFLYFGWRKKRKLHRHLEQLLNDVNDQQVIRKGQLTRRLQQSLSVSPEAAQRLSRDLLGAEKLFLQQCTAQLLQHKLDENFYAQLCELLDCYLNSLAQDNNSATQTSETDAQGIAPQTRLPAEDAAPELDWGDVFD